MNLKSPFARAVLVLAASLTAASTLVGCGSVSSESKSLTIYSGRSEEFIAPFLEAFTAETGIEVDVRYGDSAALAAQILEEGENSPADLFLSQDAGSLGAVSAAGLLEKLPAQILEEISTDYRSPVEDWVGVTGRARVFVYSPDRVSQKPSSIDDLLAGSWDGRIGIAPTNSSFQAFISALIQIRGEAATETWLNGIKANNPKFYEKNSQIVEAVDAGQIDLGLTNHYYLWEVAEDLGRDINAAIDFFAPGDLGNLVNVSGAGILKTAKNKDGATTLIEFLLSEGVQKKFVEDTHEYSLLLPELAPGYMPKLSEINSPAVDLSTLSDLRRTQQLLIKVGLI